MKWKVTQVKQTIVYVIFSQRSQTVIVSVTELREYKNIFRKI